MLSRNSYNGIGVKVKLVMPKYVQYTTPKVRKGEGQQMCRR